VLPSASAPWLSVRPPVKAGILRPIVNAVGVPKPLASALTPVSLPLSKPAARRAAVQSPAQADRPATVLLRAPAGAAPAGAATARTPAAPVPAPARHAAPAVALCSPAQPAAHPLPVQPAIGDGPVAPMPASPPGSATSPCMISGTGGGTGTGNALDVAVGDGWPMGNLTQPAGLRSRDTSGLPRSLSAEPSTSPD
jgi:hypothetical protein